MTRGQSLCRLALPPPLRGVAASPRRDSAPMRLQNLKISGFKSFPERSNLVFDNGVMVDAQLVERSSVLGEDVLEEDSHTMSEDDGVRHLHHRSLKVK